MIILIIMTVLVIIMMIMMKSDIFVKDRNLMIMAISIQVT